MGFWQRMLMHVGGAFLSAIIGVISTALLLKVSGLGDPILTPYSDYIAAENTAALGIGALLGIAIYILIQMVIPRPKAPPRRRREDDR